MEHHQRSTLPPIVLAPTKHRRLGSGSANPGPGLNISWNGKHVDITAKLQIYGPEATNDVANTIKNTIESNWNASFPDGYSVSCHVQISVRKADADEDSGATQVEIYRGASVSATMPRYWVVGSQKTQLNLNENDALTWAVAHEFAHLIGLDDHYSEGFVSKVKAIFGGQRTNTVEQGYEENIMGITGGKVESKNIRDLIDTYANVTEIGFDSDTTAQADTEPATDSSSATGQSDTDMTTEAVA